MQFNEVVQINGPEQRGLNRPPSPMLQCDGIVQEYGSEVISVLAHRLFDPHHLCIDVLHYCPHAPGRSPSEIPCNATRKWASDRELLSDPEARLGLLGARSLESIAVPDSVSEHHGGDGNINSSSRSYDEGLDQESKPRTNPGRNPEVDHGETRFGEGGVGGTVASEIRLSRSIQEQRLDSGVGAPAERPGGGVGHFLQLTDVHLDTEYYEGSEVSTRDAYWIVDNVKTFRGLFHVRLR
jgi:hypothetical protein